MQHLVKVLPWETNINNSPLKNDVKLPDYVPRGHSQRQIAASLDRAPSTVARELMRNSSRTRGYQPSYAQQQARARRWSGSRLERDASLRQQVLAGLTQAWSPEQVAGRLALAAGRQVISHESIYRFIYAQLARKKEYSWRRYLPRAKFKRGYRGRRGGSPASFIAQRRPLSQRPRDAADRRSPGHWEADLMLFRTYGQVVLNPPRTPLPSAHRPARPK